MAHRVAEEVTIAVALGGSALKGKWGTPDVIGVLKPKAQDILKFEMQIVSAEIKIDPTQPVVALARPLLTDSFLTRATSSFQILRLKTI